MSVSSLLKGGKEICHSCLTRCFWGSNEKRFENSRGYINIQTWHTSLITPFLVADQPLGCHTYEVPVLMLSPLADPGTELNTLPHPQQDPGTGISPSCWHDVGTRGLIQPQSRAGAGSWVPTLCQLLVFFLGCGRAEVGGTLPSHRLPPLLCSHSHPPWLPFWFHVLCM